MIPFIKGKKLRTFIRGYKKPIIIFALILIACFACSGCKKHTHVYTETTIFPTCSEQGYTLHTCGCGENYKDNYQKPKGHAFDKYGICSACGATRQIEVKLYVDGLYSQSVYTDSDNGYKIAVPNTPEDITSNPNSEKYFYGWFIDPNFQTPLIAGTTFCSNASIYAKWITVYSNNFKYTVNYGVATITGYVGGAPTVLVIPSYINSFPVKAISRGAFENETVIRTVIICNGIETISGFKGCNSIVDIRIPKSVKTIGCGCFENCGFVNYIIPDGITSIDDLAFSGCEKLTNIIIPNSVTSIGGGAFYGCTGLKNITIPNSVTSIEGAFSGCTGLEKITIPNSVTSIGKEAFRGCTGLKNITIPNSVTSIGWGAFYGCTGLKNITIPNSVTSIDYRAFSGCGGLTSVTIPDSVTSIGYGAFEDCSGLTSVTIPDSVTSIGGWAFSGCSGLESITLPFIGAQLNGNEETHFGYIFFVGYFHDNKGVPSSLKTVIISNSRGVTSIGSRAFEDCSGLTSVTISNSVTSIGDYAFYNCIGLTSVTIGNSVTSIGDRAFFNCSELKDIYITDLTAWCNISGLNYLMSYNSIDKKLYLNNNLVTTLTIPDSVTTISSGAFRGCSSLTSVTIPDSVTSIGNSAFYGCSSLTSVTIGNSVTSIGDSAFYGCSGLTSVTIGNSVTSIGYSAFHNCSSLTSVTIPDSVTFIGGGAFEDCSSLTSVTIGNGVTSIGCSAFEGCSGLTSVTIPDSVTFIGDGAFKDCSSLTSVIWNAENCTSAGSSSYPIFSNCLKLTNATIGENVKIIPNCAFSYCSGLTSVTIGNNVTSISEYAFYDCSGLTSVTIGNNLTSIGDYAFRGCYRLAEVINKSGLNIKKGSSNNGDIAYYALNVKKGGTSDIVNKDNYLFYTYNNVNCLLSYVGANTDLTLPANYNGQNYIICRYAFYCCRGLTSVTIPDSVTSIGEHAFYNCSGLTSVAIPDSVTSIGSDAFRGCNSLASITLPFIGASRTANSGYFQIFQVFGYIFGYTSSSDSYVSGATYQIYYNGIYYHYYIPRSLKTVILSDSVTSIGEHAFYNCSGLKAIYFNGTVAQWEKISKGYSWHYNVHSLCKVICLDGEISL